MNPNQSFDAFAVMEQHEAWCKQFAHCVATFYKTLVADGVHPSQALFMTTCYQQSWRFQLTPPVDEEDMDYE